MTQMCLYLKVVREKVPRSTRRTLGLRRDVLTYKLRTVSKASTATAFALQSSGCWSANWRRPHGLRDVNGACAVDTPSRGKLEYLGAFVPCFDEGHVIPTVRSNAHCLFTR